jgi:hypothetical protein
MRLNSVILSFVFLIPIVSMGETLTDSVQRPVNKRGLRIFTITSAAVYGGGLVGLNQLWYANSEKQSFRFFNDNAEWKQVDKIGHLYSSFYLSYGTSRILHQFNVSPTRSDVIGAIAGFALLVPIEVFDGFSDDYGASAGDLVADGAGALFFLGQKKLWSEVRIKPRFSFHTTRFSATRPEVLGDGSERILKDYNGQTYWLSFDIDKFVKFPRWLNVAVGYGAERMVYARDEQHAPNGLDRPYRQLYFSLDPDLSSIRTRSRGVRTILFFLDMIKIPSPALEISRGKLEFHALYF